MDCAVTDNLTNPKWAQIQDALNTELGKAVFGDETPVQALDKAAAKGNDLLQGANA